MDIELVIERVRRIADARADASADAGSIKGALRSSAQLRAWLAAGDAELTRRLATQVSFPEQAVADCTRSSLGDAVKATERAETLAAVPEFADALDGAQVTAAHVDEITKKAKALTGRQRGELYERAAGLVDVASVATVRDFGKRLDVEVKSIQRDDGMTRLERQRRATRLRHWTDGDGMVCISGRFDPLTGVDVVTAVEQRMQALFAQSVPATCPTDPVEKQQHLAALALASLVNTPGTATSGRRGGVVVVDASQPAGDGGPTIDWGLPVEVPIAVLADLMAKGEVDVDTVVVRNGVVLHAPGRLNLGRTSRLANRAQRRALNGLYSTCAIPGCGVHYRFTKLHHVHEWEAGGLTDLQNLLPLCPQHHARVHAERWQLSLGPNRQLTIRFPDGNVQTTGPPSRRGAA